MYDFLEARRECLAIDKPTMRLKTLEVKGFKSFAHDTVLHFNEAITGIVGPNGSGKSNIVDAIRWVLGEQKTSELRLEKMSNVIFNGTKKRKPGGMAQVSLTFENTKNLLPTEYHTVTISRVLYRTGESEYRLNGVPCRLKDITSLFLDTGIGSDSYAIIALGMVDDLLTDKDNSRRKMFEQAAGVSKYKIRKRETMLRLENTQADLNRVEDLLFEIENNLKSLEKQARRTRRYYEMREEYRNQSIDLAVFRLKDYKGRHEELHQQIQQEEDRHITLEAQSASLEAQLEAERLANLDNEKNLSERQREFNALVNHIRSRENDKAMQAQRAGFVEENLRSLRQQVLQANARLGDLENSIIAYREELTYDKRTEARLEQELQVAEDHLAQVRHSHSALKSELDTVLQNQQQLERQVFENEKNKAVYANRLEGLAQDQEQSQQAVASRKEEISGIIDQLNQLDQQIKAKGQELFTLEDQEARRQTNMAELEGSIEELRKSQLEVSRTLDAKRNEYKLTKSMVENLEGFPESIQFLSKNKSWSKEAPLLSDLIYTKEEYRVAIENYLDQYLNYYVVRNYQEAEAAIQLLSQSQKGKANFFILESLPEKHQAPSVPAHLKAALSVVECDKPYLPLMEFLLHNVAITEADELQTNQPEGLVVISRSGKYIQRRFSLSGGSVGLFEGKKIGRKKNLEVLEKEIAAAEIQVNQITEQLDGQRRQLETLRHQANNEIIKQTRAALNQLEQQQTALTTRLENAENQVREVQAKMSHSGSEYDQLQLALTHTERALEEARVALEEARMGIADTDASFKQAAEQLSAASADYNEKNIAFIKSQNKVSTLQRELGFREKQLEETRDSLEKNNSGIQQAEVEVTELKAAISTLDIELQEQLAMRQEMESLLTEAEQAYFKGRGGINEIEENLRKTNRALNECQNLTNKLKDQYTGIKLELTSIGERLRVEFNVEMEEILKLEVKEDVDYEALKANVDKLKYRLDTYGEINPMAMEAYDEMKERYDGIKTQRDDILAAKQSLLDTIQEIETTATQQFMGAFETVREHFISVFRTLFTEEDTCDLVLVDPEHPLESPINIIARPKGKRPQTINQLSGGEKTLTATALLFALYLYKPAPFCIFDEVDAPLDDANIEKFNKIIRRFSDDSQFIIVTHNKATMAAVDVIYGVYLAEQGVSSVASVDFRALDHNLILTTN